MNASKSHENSTPMKSESSIQQKLKLFSKEPTVEIVSAPKTSPTATGSPPAAHLEVIGQFSPVSTQPPPPPPPPPPLPPQLHVSKLGSNMYVPPMNPQPHMFVSPQQSQPNLEDKSNVYKPRPPVIYSPEPVRSPPASPSPDYDLTPELSPLIDNKLKRDRQPNFNKILEVKSGEATKQNTDRTSLESFTITDTDSPKPKPPPIYFENKRSHPKSSGVMVSVNSYESKPMPNKLDFLPSVPRVKVVNKFDETKRDYRSNLNSQFHSELNQTINRSNLRQRCGSADNLLDSPSSVTTVSVNGGLTSASSHSSLLVSNKPNSVASLSARFTEFASMSGQSSNPVITNSDNRVTISLQSDSNDGSCRMNGLPCGILKNGNGSHRSLLSQKSISFGEM